MAKKDEKYVCQMTSAERGTLTTMCGGINVEILFFLSLFFPGKYERCFIKMWITSFFDRNPSFWVDESYKL